MAVWRCTGNACTPRFVNPEWIYEYVEKDNDYEVGNRSFAWFNHVFSLEQQIADNKTAKKDANLEFLSNKFNLHLSLTLLHCSAQNYDEWSSVGRGNAENDPILTNE